MTSEFFIIILLSAIFTLLFVITIYVTTENKETKELLKQIRNNTNDKTKPVKPVNVTVSKSNIIKYANCPICEKLTSSHFKHCDNCGAEIDWSDTE